MERRLLFERPQLIIFYCFFLAQSNIIHLEPVGAVLEFRAPRAAIIRPPDGLLAIIELGTQLATHTKFTSFPKPPAIAHLWRDGLMMAKSE